MTRCRSISVILLALALIVAGCTGVPEHPQETTASFIDRQISLAHRQEQNQEFATALSHWRVVLLLDPSHTEGQQRASELQNILTSRADSAFKAGKSARRSGNNKLAKVKFLDALAAVPSHLKAKQELEKMQTSRMLRSQNKKTLLERQYKQPMEQRETTHQIASRDEQSSVSALQNLLRKEQYQLLINRAEGAINDQNRNEVNSLLGQAHIELCRDDLSKNSLKEASQHFDTASILLTGNTRTELLGKELATAYHQKGRRLLTTDIDQGIVYLQESLKYDPSNRHVQGLLKQSQSLKKRLSEISTQQQVL